MKMVKGLENDSFIMYKRCVNIYTYIFVEVNKRKESGVRIMLTTENNREKDGEEYFNLYLKEDVSLDYAKEYLKENFNLTLE